MTDPAVTIHTFETLLSQASENARGHAYRFARYSLRAAIYYLRAVTKHYPVAHPLP